METEREHVAFRLRGNGRVGNEEEVRGGGEIVEEAHWNHMFMSGVHISRIRKITRMHAWRVCKPLLTLQQWTNHSKVLRSTRHRVVPKPCQDIIDQS